MSPKIFFRLWKQEPCVPKIINEKLSYAILPFMISYRGGVDSEGRPVMVVVGAHFLLRCLDLERFVLYIVKVLDFLNLNLLVLADKKLVLQFGVLIFLLYIKKTVVFIQILLIIF